MKKQVMKNEPCIVMKIYETGIFIEEHNENGTVSYKRTELDELIKIINLSTIKSKTLTVDSNQLPSNCIRHIAVTDGKTTTNSYILYIEEGYYNFTYYKDVYKDFYIPNLLFAFTIKNNRIDKSRVFVVKEKANVITEDTILYRYPFGNVYSDGRICWGTNELPNIKVPTQLKGIPYMFITSPTVDDLYNPINNLTQRELISDLVNKKINITDVLSVHSYYKTYGELLKGLASK